MLLDDPATIAAAVLAIVLIGLAKGGFAGLGALGTPLLALVLPPATAAALLLPILIAQDAISVWSFRKEWDRWVIAWMLPGAVTGIALGYAFAASVDERALMAALGLITLSFGAWRLWIGRGGRIAAPSQSPGWVGTLFGVATGITSQIAHAGGPPFQMWVAPRGLPHARFVGTQAVLFAVVNLVKVPAFFQLGVLTRPVLLTAAALLPLAIASTLAGVWLVRRVETAWFYLFVYWLMVALGAWLVLQGIRG
jgi:uncharacterized membrane protein YfcA